MSATHAERIDRIHRLVAMIPHAQTASARCPDVGRLLGLLDDQLAGQASHAARRRMLQRDLVELTRDGVIETVNPGGKPLRYRRVQEVRDDDPAVLAFTRQQISACVADLVPHQRLNALWRELLGGEHGPVLDDTQLRILPDTLRLLPADIAPRVLAAVIAALTEQHALKVLYQNNAGERSRPHLHPQALVQRGPVTYLLALKNAEDEPVRFYALHRLVRARVLDEPARRAADFDLDRAIEHGHIDFGSGKMLDLELRARGYLDAVLRDCPLSPDQTLTDEPAASAFSLRITARVPSSGALLRWLLAGGPNLEVVAPAELRAVLGAQATKMAAIYPTPDPTQD